MDFGSPAILESFEESSVAVSEEARTRGFPSPSLDGFGFLSNVVGYLYQFYPNMSLCAKYIYVEVEIAKLVLISDTNGPFIAWNYRIRAKRRTELAEIQSARLARPCVPYNTSPQRLKLSSSRTT